MPNCLQLLVYINTKCCRGGGKEGGGQRGGGEREGGGEAESVHYQTELEN